MADPLTSIVDSTYPSMLHNLSIHRFFQDRTILAPTNEIVDKINDYVMSLIPGEAVEYMSADCICKEDGGVAENEDFFSVEFLNTIRCFGLPNHVIKLKVGVPVMLLRNIDQSMELCNGTRMVVTRLLKHVIEARMLSGSALAKRCIFPE